MQDSSWSLLSASLRGETDDRAVAELREAWRTPGLVEGMSALSLTLPARTAWTIARARAALPADEALRALAGEAFGVLELALRKRSPDAAKAETFAAQVFLALLRNEPDVPAELVRLLPSPDAVRARPVPEGLAAVAASLFGGGSAAAVLSALEERSIRGDDWTVLAALVLRQGGGDAWTRFRASKADLLAGAAVSGAAFASSTAWRPPGCPSRPRPPGHKKARQRASPCGCCPWSSLAGAWARCSLWPTAVSRLGGDARACRNSARPCQPTGSGATAEMAVRAGFLDRLPLSRAKKVLDNIRTPNTIRRPYII
jgi:hypothetical protein